MIRTGGVARGGGTGGRPGPAGDRVPVAAPQAGLTTAEAARRLAVNGPNELPRPRKTPVWRMVAEQARDPLVMVLLIAAALTLATGDWADAGVIALVLVVNTAAGVTQEVKAGQAIAALTELTAPEARVLRDGAQHVLPAAEIVVGDVLVLAEGDIVPADAVVTEAAALLIDESALTGESVPVDKIAIRQLGTGDEVGGMAGERSVVSAGTTVVRGRGRAVVTATGVASSMGRIAALLGGRQGLTPLQRRLAGLGRLLAIAAVVLCLIVMTIGLARGQDPELMVVTAISLVVAAVPESLPAVVTLALALGARRMSARNALIRRLPAVETLGSVTVLGTDKTGTLTEGSMVARRLWTPAGGVASVTGAGYAPAGEITGSAGSATEVAALLTAAALCTDAALKPPGIAGTSAAAGGPAADEWTAVGDPTEAALLAVAGKAGLDPDALRRRFPRLAEIPFDSGRQRMTTVHQLPDGQVRVICKGAPEVLLSGRLTGDDPGVLRQAAAQAEELARSGFRVLAVAAADRPEQAVRDGEPDPATLERGLRLLGLTAILDPPRPAAKSTVAAARAAGITPVLITGDHPATAGAIARELGVTDAGAAGEAEVVDCRDPAAPAAYRTGRVFARANPEQKLAIIQARRAAGDVVAMTGDGVNDGPALRSADIGVAMGKRGTEVARQAADLVLADDELSTVVAAAEEGRRVYANIRRFLLYGLAGGSAEIIVMLLGPLFGMPLPLLPAQILWVNLLTHGLPGVALGSEPADPAAMRQPPRPPAESVLGAGLWQRIARVGVVIAAVTLGVAYWAHATGRPWQTMAFFALGATQLAVAAGSRARPGTWANPALPLSIAGALALQFAGVYVPFLNDLLKTEPLTWLDLLVVFALSLLGYAAIRLDRIVHPERPPAARGDLPAAAERQRTVHRRHRRRQRIECEQPRLENLPPVKYQAVQAAGQPGLVVDLGLQALAAVHLKQPADGDRQPGLLAYLADDRLLEGLPVPREPARKPPLPLRRPQPVPQQQHPSVRCPHDPGHADGELGADQPGDRSLRRPQRVPGPRQQVAHARL
jgi:Ca2+-transporting ATPase